MTQPLVVLAVDEDRTSQAAVAQAFNQQGVTYRFITDRRKVAGGLKQLTPTAIIVFGELNSDFVIQVLDALNLDVAYSNRPVIVVCKDQTDRNFVDGFRSGVVALLQHPFVPDHVNQVKKIWAELPSRAGIVTGSGDGTSIAQMIDHVRRTRRSGILVLSPRTSNEGRATFVNGRLERARFLAASGVEALRAMAHLPKVQWTFAEVAGRHGDGAGVVIEIGDIMSGEMPVADVVVGDAILEDAQGVFEVDLPPPPPPTSLSPIPTAGTTPATRILLVDDDEAILRMFGTLFQKHGFDVTTATDGNKGAAIALEGPFDLALADLNMPYLDGWGMLRILRDDYRTRELPIAFVSAHDDYRESLRALDAGAQAYLSKGTRLDAIVAQAKKLLEPRTLVLAQIEMGAQKSIQIHAVGPQWFLRQLAQQQRSGTVHARDGWASYTLGFVDGVCIHASAIAGKFTAEGERAFNAFVSTRAAEGEFTGGELDPNLMANLSYSTEVLLERACATLNENERRVRENLLVNATHIDVNEQLYEVYRQVGPHQWLECARLICEERLAPREIISRLDISPVDIEETMKDLLRRGVVMLKKA